MPLDLSRVAASFVASATRPEPPAPVAEAKPPPTQKMVLLVDDAARAVLPLSPREEHAREMRFAEQFLRCGRNSVEAARRAGFARPSLDGPRVVRLAHVQEAIRRATSEALSVLDITPDAVLLELGRIAKYDPRRTFRADGTAKDPHELDDDTAAAIKKIDRGPFGTKYEFMDKGAALTSIAKIHGMVQTHATVTVSGKVDHEHRVAKAIGGLEQFTAEEIDELMALAPAAEGEQADQDSGVIDAEYTPSS